MYPSVECLFVCFSMGKPKAVANAQCKHSQYFGRCDYIVVLPACQLESEHDSIFTKMQFPSAANQFAT